MCTFNHDNDPRVNATSGSIIDALTAAAKETSEVDDVERTCCMSFNRHLNVIAP